jgi:hypothetical protein
MQLSEQHQELKALTLVGMGILEWCSCVSRFGVSKMLPKGIEQTEAQFAIIIVTKI